MTPKARALPSITSLRGGFRGKTDVPSRRTRGLGFSKRHPPVRVFNPRPLRGGRTSFRAGALCCSACIRHNAACGGCIRQRPVCERKVDGLRLRIFCRSGTATFNSQRPTRRSRNQDGRMIWGQNDGIQIILPCNHSAESEDAPSNAFPKTANHTWNLRAGCNEFQN